MAALRFAKVSIGLSCRNSATPPSFEHHLYFAGEAAGQHINNLFIIGAMIESFASAETERLFATGKSRRLPPDILRRAVMRLTQLDAATVIDDLRLPPSNRLEALLGSRAGQWSIRINEQWRVCFRFERGNAQDVEIVDYH